MLTNPRLNRGTAFTQEQRRELDLVGLVPAQVLTLEQQAERAYQQYRAQPSDLAKHVYLSALHDRNEVLFYRLIGDHLAEMLPIVYTPTVGTAVERYIFEYRRPRGIYLSADAPDDIETSLRASGLGSDDVDLIVATDGAAILRIGDWGVGGASTSRSVNSPSTRRQNAEQPLPIPRVLPASRIRRPAARTGTYGSLPRPFADTSMQVRVVLTNADRNGVEHARSGLSPLEILAALVDQRRFTPFLQVRGVDQRHPCAVLVGLFLSLWPLNGPWGSMSWTPTVGVHTIVLGRVRVKGDA